MKNQIIWIVTLLMMIGLVNALPMCIDGQKEIYTNCTMVTPAMNTTSYTYSIYNLTGSEITSGNLKHLAGQIYQFNFTEEVGYYVIKLSDGSTREVYVIEEEDGKMIVGVLILIPMILAFFLLIGAMNLNEEHSILKMFMYMIGIALFWISMHIGTLSLIKFYEWPELEELLGTITWITGLIFITLISYFAINIIYKIFIGIGAKKQEKLKY